MRFRSVVAAGVVALASLGSVAPGPIARTASAADAGFYINGATVGLGTVASEFATGVQSQTPTEQVAWYVCDTATSFVSTRASDGAPAPSDEAASLVPITSELADNGCVFVASGDGAELAQFYADDATLFKKPTKPFLTYTVRWSNASVSYAVNAVAVAARLRTLQTFPSLTRNATTFTAVDATWGESPGNWIAPRSTYWTCGSPVAAGSGMLNSTIGPDPTSFTGAISGCRPLYEGFWWEPEAEQFFPINTTATALSANATLYTEAPASEFDSPVPVDLTGKHIIRVSVGFPYITWTGSQPWTLTAPAYTTQGYFQPVDTARTVNDIRRGSVLPLKFRVFDGVTPVTDPSIISFSVVEVECANVTRTIGSPIQFEAAGSTTLRWSTDGNQFVHNWRVPATVGKCYRVTHTVGERGDVTLAGASLPTNVVTTVVRTR